MKIIWLGHGSFRVELADQVLLTDPWLTGNPVLPAIHKAYVNWLSPQWSRMPRHADRNRTNHAALGVNLGDEIQHNLIYCCFIVITKSKIILWTIFMQY